MSGRLAPRLLAPVVKVHQGEVTNLLLMFGYSFLAMAAYNIVQPIVRSRLIDAISAVNVPWVLLGSVFVVGPIMLGYARLGGLLPGRWLIPMTQAGMVGLLAVFWVLSALDNQWVEVAFYLFGQIYGILLISQFWTVANLIYNPREAKRVFGFIGAGASLGGILGGSIPTFMVDLLGTRSLMLVSAGFLVACGAVVSTVVARARDVDFEGLEHAGQERGVGGAEALRMLRQSRHLQLVSVVIALTSVGAGLIDQQLNMATEFFQGRENTNAMTRVLGSVQVYTSAIGFFIQVFLTSRIHRMLGVGFALLILPVGLAAMGGTILLNAALWAPMLARVYDKSIRYTVDKTSREVLFLPLPADLKQRAKPFVDVTVDRAGRALQAVILLVLIQPWGLGLSGALWNQISWASLPVIAFWMFMVLRAKRAYVAAFRQNMETREVVPAELRTTVADLSTIETLVEELASREPERVVYAIDMLEALDKPNLISPLLLRHESPDVRIRVLGALTSMRIEIATPWTGHVEDLLKDDSAAVRAAAVRTLAALHGESVGALMRPHLDDLDPRVAATAAMALADSADEDDVRAADAAIRRLTDDTHEAAAEGRREVAAALGGVRNPAFRLRLVPLMHDANLDVALKAIQSAAVKGVADMILVPGLISLLGHRVLKSAAREVLVSYGDDVLDALAHFLKDPKEDIWVRRHIPATIVRLPSPRVLPVLLEVLEDPDGFLRYKVLMAIERLRRDHPGLSVPEPLVERLVLKETSRYYNFLTLRHNLQRDAEAPRSLLVRALDEKLDRTLDRVYRLLGLIYPYRDVVSARHAIARGAGRARAGAVEFMDNLLRGAIRKRVMPIIEDAPIEEKVRTANSVLKSRPRDLEDTLAQLVHEDDPVVSAAAIQFVEKRGVWALSDDLEYVLEHRSASDWYVFEAASWALAGRRLSQRRGQLWMEPLPAVELADRLRDIPAFDVVSVDELFRIGGSGRQTRYEAGRELYLEGEPSEDVHFLLEGSVRRSAGGAEPADLNAPAALGFEEVLDGSPFRHTVRAVERAICLSLASGEFLTMLSDNIMMAQGLFRMMLEEPHVRQWRLLHGPPAVFRPPDGDRPLPPFETMMLLRHHGLLRRATANQLMSLAAAARDVPLMEGRTLVGESDSAVICVVVQGEVRLEREARDDVVAGPGSTIGMLETLAGVSLAARAVVARTGRALWLEQEEMFDVLADHVDLVQSLFSALRDTPATLAASGSVRSGAAIH
jgi:ATP/ADP translocase/CRP-like cAMP-binding protein/HEAT repeat protein